jgi:hypothetical protein
MDSMSIFLSLSERFTDALETFDPLRGEWLLRIADPWPSARGGGKVAWARLSAVTLTLIAPVWLFSAVPSSTFGGNLVGPGSLTADLGFYGIMFYIAATLALIPIARRILGDLINELIRRRTVSSVLRTFTPASVPTGRLLRFLEWLSRPAGFRGLIWYLLLAADQLWIYYVFLTDGKATWLTSPAEPGTIFYPFRIGSEQPNLAGLWTTMTVGPIGLYMVVLVARLFVAFACLCSALAQNIHLRIYPSHPDRTGGLQPIGQVALLLSLFICIIGLDLFGMTANEFALNGLSHSAAPHGQTNLMVLSALWASYIVIGSILFFLPLLPLRRRMAAAKRRYLLEANELHVAAERKHQEEIHGGVVDPASLQGLVALEVLIESSAQMAVWPFDQRTFVRYAGLLFAPLVPVVGEHLPRALGFIKSYLGLR